MPCLIRGLRSYSACDESRDVSEWARTQAWSSVIFWSLQNFTEIILGTWVEDGRAPLSNLTRETLVLVVVYCNFRIS